MCQEKKEEFVSYDPVEADGEVINGNRIIVEKKVYNLDQSSYKEKLVKKALKKLEPEEKAALTEHFSK